MGGVSALMSIGLFAIDLNPDYYKGKVFRIVTHGNSRDNCYI